MNNAPSTSPEFQNKPKTNTKQNEIEKRLDEAADWKDEALTAVKETIGYLLGQVITTRQEMSAAQAAVLGEIALAGYKSYKSIETSGWKDKALTTIKGTIGYLLAKELAVRQELSTAQTATLGEIAFIGYELYKSIEASESAEQASALLRPGIATIKWQSRTIRAAIAQEEDSQAAENFLRQEGIE